MRIDGPILGGYGSGFAFIHIQHGVVRDIVQEEAEWGNGPTNCPNVYYPNRDYTSCECNILHLPA